jgi:hypothetical protein
MLVMLTGHIMTFAQSGPNEIISKDNVSIDKVRSILENTYYEIKESTATYVLFKDIFSIYADLDKDNRYITLSVNWPVNETFSLEDKFNLLNTISKEVLVVTPYYNAEGTSLIVKTTIWIEGGMTAKNIVFTEKIFVKALNLILDKDTLGIIK